MTTGASPQLLAVGRRLSDVARAFDTQARCIYVDYPLHANIGDLLINLGSERFFQEHGLHIWRRYNQYDFPRHIPGIRRDDVFLLHGGGNLGDMWEPYQSFRESILERYPENRVIFLPQTVHFRSHDRKIESVRRMTSHRNLHVFLRDHVSLERLQSAGLACVSLAPDMAHSLFGLLKPTHEANPGSVLRLIRDDREASPLPGELRADGASVLDWDRGTLGVSRRMLHPFVVRAVKGIGRYARPVDAHGLWYWHRNRLVRDGVDLFSQYETIVTNRLHGVLLGLLLGKEVRAWDNSYGKLSAYYESWLLDIPGLTFCQRMPEESLLTSIAGN